MVRPHRREDLNRWRFPRTERVASFQPPLRPPLGNVGARGKDRAERRVLLAFAPLRQARRDVAERRLCLPPGRHEAIAASAPGNPGSTCGAVRSEVNGRSRACSSGRLNPG